MNFLTIIEDVRQLFINSEALKEKVKSLGASTGAEQKVKEIAVKYIENIEGEILAFNEFISTLAECSTDEDLGMFVDDFGDED